MPAPESKALAIILARAGSKGVPGKNAAIVAGKPCAAWTIAQAQASKHIGRVALTTDDAALAELARTMGTQVIQRPPALATDSARVDDAVRHAVEQIERQGPLSAGAPIVILYANVPVRPADLIDRAVALLVDSGCDSVQSYTTVGKHHPWWMIRLDEASGAIKPWEGQVLYHNIFRRQDLPPAYVPDGGVVALTRRALFCQVPGVQDGPHAFLGIDRRGIATPEGSVIDIDAPVDLLAADAKLRDIAAQASPRTAGGRIG